MGRDRQGVDETEDIKQGRLPVSAVSGDRVDEPAHPVLGKMAIVDGSESAEVETGRKCIGRWENVGFEMGKAN